MFRYVLGEIHSASFRALHGYAVIGAVCDCTVPGRHELLPTSGVSYVGFLEPSGSSLDAFTMAIAHLEADRVLLDCVREQYPPGGCRPSGYISR